MPRRLAVTVKAQNLPKVTRLYKATHRVLLEQLEVGWGQRKAISIQAWNELIAAHDDLSSTEGAV